MGPLDAAATAKATELGVQLQIMDGKADNQVMLDQAMNLIAQKVDAIIFCPSDMAGSVTIVKKINEAKIPLIISSARVDKSVEQLTTTLCAADPEFEGEVVGKLAAEKMVDGGKVAIVEGYPGTEAQIARSAGFIKGTASNAKIQIVAQQTANWDRAKAMALAEDYITKYPDLAAIYAQDDNMAIGVVEAVKAAGKLDQIKVFGLGYMGEEVKKALKAGELFGTCTQSPKEEGTKVVEMAVKAINGEVLEKWYKTACVGVTKENADTIDSGF